MDRPPKTINHLLLANKADQSSEFEAESESRSGISHENSQCVKREKIQKLKKKKRRIYSTKSKGNWNLDQDIRFMNFMLQNRQSFENRDLRRTNKIFKKMARFVKTRCPEQCRSHHQKYEKKYTDFDTIVGFISSKAYNIHYNQAKIEAQHQNQGYLNLLENKEQKKRRPYNRKQSEKKKKQLPTIAPIQANKFSLYTQEKDCYRILLAYEPKLEIKVMIEFDNVAEYRFGK